MHHSIRRVFVISLDGATWDVLHPLMNQGYLPHLAQFLKDGLSAELESVLPPVTPAAWTSFMTGKNPEKHGIFDFTNFDPLDHRWELTNSQSNRSKTLWQILSEKGKRSIVLNLPWTFPARPANGIMVAGWDAPVAETGFTYPEDFRQFLAEKFPDSRSYFRVNRLMPQKSKKQFDEYIDELIRGFEQGTLLARYLLEHETWDFFMVHFQQTDWIQHRLWGHIATACKDAREKTPEVEAVRNCYKRFDDLVGTLLERVSPRESAIAVLSDHGFGPRRGDIYPNYFLAQWGYLYTNRNETSAIEKLKASLRHSKVPGLKALYQVLRKVRNSIQKEANPIQEHKDWADALGTSLSKRRALIDWTKTKVVTIYAYQFAYLYVNVCGRSPNGLVQPGAEYESLISALMQRFRDIRHPETSEKLLEAVVRGADMYRHAPNDILVPDLVLIPTDGYDFSFLISDEPPKNINEGNHRHNGVFMIQGPGLKRALDGFSPTLADMAPTLLQLLGLPIPSDMDGRVLQEIFESPLEIRIEQVDNQLSPEERRTYSKEEEYLIEERLKGLGYVE